MTPFIIWLEKEEVDQLIGNLLITDNEVEVNKLLTSEELLNLTQNLLNQNNELIHLFRKIKPFDKIQQNAVTNFSIKQKCEFYKEQVNKMKTHCSVYKDTLECEHCPTFKLPLN